MTAAYHFVGDTLRDGRAIPPDGEWLIHDGPVVMCQSGLHASRDPFDALTYAPGDTLCVVECALIVSEDSDKLVCHQRRIIARRNATAMLCGFARAQALTVAHLWNCPPVVRQYLETGDESLRAAAWAASNAAWTASADASAARDAASAARYAAWDARAAASDAAWTVRVAASAASDAASAARAAAWDAARTAWGAARADFNRRVAELFA